MKKRYLIILGILMFFITGCFEYNSNDALEDLEKKYKNLKSYQLDGTLEIVNNEDIFLYNVNVIFQKEDKYRVSLKNKNNNHEQIILKNSDGVYVLTPSLNKSFKFQSDWPYNNSQVYLIKSILDDIKNDKEKDIIEKDAGYQITTTVNYPNNRKLVRQIITIDKELNLKEVKVVDESDITQMKMTFETIDLSPNIKSDTFELNSIMKEQETPSTNENKSDTENSTETTTSSLDNIIYPLYIPSGTTLTNQDTIKKDNGERIIMTFEGEKPFLLVEETSSIAEELEIIPTFGEPCIILDTLASITQNSITWSSSGVDYYLVSNVMSQDELLEIARSISTIPTMK